MLYSAAKRFIFSQTPRCASTSTAFLLQPYCCPPGTTVVAATPEMVTEYGIVGQRGEFAADPVFYVHMPLRAIREALPAGVWERCLKVANIRNPFTMKLSRFSRLKRIGALGPFADLSAERDAFQQFVMEWSRDDEWQQKEKARFLIGTDLAIDHLVCFEDLDAAIAQLIGRLDLSPDGAFSHQQQSRDQLSGRSLADYFSPQTTRAIKAKAGWAFDCFGYSTDIEDCFNVPQGFRTTVPLASAPSSREDWI